MKIEKIVARQIIDSRGNPTIEADVWVAGGIFGRAAVPSGASTGIHEAHELRDGETAYGGLGVTKAIHNIEGEILASLRGIPADDQFLIDGKMIALDGTSTKSRLGANATLAVSLACAHASAKVRGIPLYKQINDIAGNPAMSLPRPMMNVLNGGRHATGSSDFQEFMLIPQTVNSFREALRVGVEIFQALKKEIHSANVSTAVGDEGGFTYPIRESNTEMLDLLITACASAGFKVGQDVGFGLDVASSEFYQQERYVLETESRALTTGMMISYLEQIVASYPVLSIEDGLAEDDWNGWVKATELLGEKIQLVGDDLLVTNPDRLKHAVEVNAGNAILIKPNQIGTLTETLQAISIAKQNGWNTIISHRSGETEDVSIAHIAVGTGAGQIKTGSLSRGERTAKYNELLRIEQNDASIPYAK